MTLAVDVYYKLDKAKAVGIIFDRLTETVTSLKIANIEHVDEYKPGEFYRRELPCIMAIIDQIELSEIDLIIVDGHVYVDDDASLGLGGRLWEMLHKKIPVIGVAKTSFIKNKKTVEEIKRGISEKPLYVSAVGIDLASAAFFVKNMKGPFRMPDLLKLLDEKTKESI